MKTLFGAVVSLAMATAASAATVTVDDDMIRLSGDFAWVGGEGFIDPVRSTAGYELALPVAGSPFDPSFVPPGPVGQVAQPIIGEGISVTIGDPQTRDIDQTGAVSAQVVNYDTPRFPIVTPGGDPIDPQPVLTDQYVGLTGLRYVTDGFEGTSNITNANFFLNFNEDYSELVSISATHVVESSIFVPIPGGESVVEAGILVALGFAGFEPIRVADFGGPTLPGDPNMPAPTPIPLPASFVLMAAAVGALGFARRMQRNRDNAR